MIKHTITKVSDDESRMDFAGGYYLLTLNLRRSSREDGPSMLFCDPIDGNLYVAIDPDAYFNPDSVVRGIERKIKGVEEHLEQLKTALRVITEG